MVSELLNHRDFLKTGAACGRRSSSVFIFPPTFFCWVADEDNFAPLTSLDWQVQELRGRQVGREFQLLGGRAKPGARQESFVGPPLFRPNSRSDYGIEVLNLEVDLR
jgi:hypothetical protein